MFEEKASTPSKMSKDRREKGAGLNISSDCQKHISLMILNGENII